MGQAAKDKNDTTHVPRTKLGAPAVKSFKVPAKDEHHFTQLPLYMGEITWRVAVPILVFTLGGHWLDGRFDTRPALSIAGVLLSVVFSSLLVYRFLARAFPESFGGKK